MYRDVLTIIDGLKSNNPESVINAIKQAAQLGEPMENAIYSYALARDLPGKAKEIIAKSEYSAITDEQIATRLAIELADTSSLTREKWQAISALLNHLRPSLLKRDLRSHGQIQLDVLINWLHHQNDRRVRRRISRSLFRLTGTLRSDAKYLVQSMPFLMGEIEKLKPQWEASYLGRTYTKTMNEICSGGAFVTCIGFVCVMALMTALVWGTDDSASDALQSATSSDATQIEPNETDESNASHGNSLNAVFKKLAEEKVLAVIDGRPVLVLPDNDSRLVAELLSQHHTGPIFTSRRNLSPIADGREWLNPEDLPVLGYSAIEKLVVASFEESRLGRRIVFSDLQSGEIELCFSYQSDSAPAPVSFESLVRRANISTREGDTLRASMLLRMALTVASTEQETGMANLFLGGLLYNAGKPSVEFAPYLRRAFVQLDPQLVNDIPKVIRDEYSPAPGLDEQVDSMTLLKP